MKAYFCKFIPPRADFLATLSDQEKALMQQHAEFLDQRLAEGILLAHGPVIDETGGFGLSLYQIADDQDICRHHRTGPDHQTRHRAVCALPHAAFEGARIKRRAAYGTLKSSSQQHVAVTRARRACGKPWRPQAGCAQATLSVACRPNGAGERSHRTGTRALVPKPRVGNAAATGARRCTHMSPIIRSSPRSRPVTSPAPGVKVSSPK